MFRAVQTGNLLFVAGLGPAAREDGTTPNGKVGKDLTLDEGYEAARLVGINLLARLKSTLGDLDRVERIVKLLSMVNCTPEFNQQPQVANGCSDLLVKYLERRDGTRVPRWECRHYPMTFLSRSRWWCKCGTSRSRWWLKRGTRMWLARVFYISSALEFRI